MAEAQRVQAKGLALSQRLPAPGRRALLQARYRAGELRYGVRGVWDREDGGVFRHHTRAGLDRLLQGFDVVAERQAETTTFSGAQATAIQVLARRSAGGREQATA